MQAYCDAEKWGSFIKVFGPKFQKKGLWCGSYPVGLMTGSNEYNYRPIEYPPPPSPTYNRSSVMQVPSRHWHQPSFQSVSFSAKTSLQKTITARSITKSCNDARFRHGIDQIAIYSEKSKHIV
jgi:hypothetical protein